MDISITSLMIKCNLICDNAHFKRIHLYIFEKNEIFSIDGGRKAPILKIFLTPS